MSNICYILTYHILIAVIRILAIYEVLFISLFSVILLIPLMSIQRLLCHLQSLFSTFRQSPSQSVSLWSTSHHCFPMWVVFSHSYFLFLMHINILFYDRHWHIITYHSRSKYFYYSPHLLWNAFIFFNWLFWTPCFMSIVILISCYCYIVLFSSQLLPSTRSLLFFNYLFSYHHIYVSIRIQNCCFCFLSSNL